MSEPSKQAQLRAERLAKALRSNLGRRKLQARRRDASPSEEKHANHALNIAEQSEKEME